MLSRASSQPNDTRVVLRTGCTNVNCNESSCDALVTLEVGGAQSSGVVLNGIRSSCDVGQIQVYAQGTCESFSTLNIVAGSCAIVPTIGFAILYANLSFAKCSCRHCDSATSNPFSSFCDSEGPGGVPQLVLNFTVLQMPCVDLQVNAPSAPPPTTVQTSPSPTAVTTTPVAVESSC